MNLIWGLFSTLSKCCTPSPSFEPSRFQVLSFHAETSVAKAHIQEEYLPRFEFAERHIEQRSPSDSLSEALHMLHVLSLIEDKIQKWKERHQFEVITTPKAVHTLYCRLFNKTEPPRKLLSSFPPTKGCFTLLSNTSKMNCFFNVALQTLFSNLELAAGIVFSDNQLPEVKFAFLAYREAVASGKMDPLDLATTLRMLYPCFIEEGHHDASEALVKIIEPADRERAPFCTLTRKTIYAGHKSHIEETREAVYALEIPDKGCFTLEEALYQGALENQRKLAAMVLIFQTLDALNGAVNRPTPDQIETLSHLTQFINSLLDGEPSYDAFKELPLSLQNLLLNLWSTGGDLDQMVDHLDDQLEEPFSIPKTYDQDVFSGSFDLIPPMADLLAKRLYKHPEGATTLKTHYDLIILSLGQISKQRAMAHHRSIVRRARIVNSLFREVGQFSLTCGAVALKLTSDNKAVTVENLKKESAVVLQSISSLARFLFTGMDPLGQNKYLQLGQQFITPTLAMAQHRQDRGVWSFAPLASSALNLGVSQISLSEPTKALAGNFAPLLFTDVLFPSYKSSSTLPQFASLALSHLLHPNGKEAVASRLSALYSCVAQLATPRLEQHTDPDHIQTSPQGWAARTLQVVITNSALQSLVTETAAQRLRPSKALPALSPLERKAIRDQKYQELKRAIQEGDEKSAQFHADEITHLEHQLKLAGVHLETDPLQLQEILDAHQQYGKQAIAFNDLVDKREQALKAEDHETAERIEQELSRHLTELEALREQLGLPSQGAVESSPTAPTINLEVERHIEITAAQLASAREVLFDKDEGVRIAKAKVDEKFAKYQKAQPKDEKKAYASLERARENLRNFTRERDHQKEVKVEFLERKLTDLKERIHSPVDHQDYLNRVTDERAYLEQSERQRLTGIVNEKKVAASKAEKEMLAKFKKYKKVTWGSGNKEFKAYWKAREKYTGIVDELNIARVSCELSPQTAFPKKAPPKKGPIEKAYDATSDFLTRIGFSGGASTRPLPLYTTEPPKSTPSHIGDYGPVIPAEPAIHPITAPSPVAQPYAAPVLQNPFLPTAPNTLPPVSMPSLPARPVAAPSPRPSFGERLQGAVRELFDHGLPNSAPLQPRTQVMIFPQEPSTLQNSLPGFTPNLQTRYPEAYALARQVDQFGKEQVALFRITLENHPSPRLFREFDELPTLLERATGHTLHTPGLTPERPTPLNLRVETLAVATIDLVRDYNRHRMEHPFQSQLDIVLAAPRVVGGWAKDAFKLLNYLTKLKHPNDPITREMGARVDILAQSIDSFYVETIQRLDPGYNPHSASSRVGEVAWSVVPIGRAATAGRALRSGTASRGLLSLEEVAARRMVAQRVFLERMNNPVYRSGVPKIPKNPSSGTVTRELQNIRVKTPLTSQEIVKLEKEVSSWLGEGTKLIRNKAGDPIFLSKDCLRKVRFDFNRPYPHENPHLHFDKYVKGRWVEVKRIYPSDVPHK